MKKYLNQLRREIETGDIAIRPKKHIPGG